MFRTSRITNPFNNNKQHDKSNDDRRSVNATTITSSCRQQQLLANHHPNVKLPPRLQDQSKHEQIKRSCDRFKGYPNAVDTLYKTLKQIQNHPQEDKYRRIDTTHPGYQRSLANIPGTEGLIRVIHFVPPPNNNTLLILRHLNTDLLNYALTCLEETKQTQEYQNAKNELDFVKEIHHHCLLTKPSEEELAHRATLLAKVPEEAMEGRGTLIHITIPSSSEKKKAIVLQRRFDGDDTLLDVIHWLGGTMGTIFVRNLLETQQWSFVDRNRINNNSRSIIDCSDANKRTLQYHGLWPGGKLLLCPSPSSSHERTSVLSTIGESRGLASGI